MVKLQHCAVRRLWQLPLAALAGGALGCAARWRAPARPLVRAERAGAHGPQGAAVWQHSKHTGEKKIGRLVVAGAVRGWGGFSTACRRVCPPLPAAQRPLRAQQRAAQAAVPPPLLRATVPVALRQPLPCRAAHRGSRGRPRRFQTAGRPCPSVRAAAAVQAARARRRGERAREMCRSTTTAFSHSLLWGARRFGLCAGLLLLPTHPDRQCAAQAGMAPVQRVAGARPWPLLRVAARRPLLVLALLLATMATMATAASAAAAAHTAQTASDGVYLAVPRLSQHGWQLDWPARAAGAGSVHLGATAALACPAPGNPAHRSPAPGVERRGACSSPALARAGLACSHPAFACVPGSHAPLMRRPTRHAPIAVRTHPSPNLCNLPPRPPAHAPAESLAPLPKQARTAVFCLAR